MNLKAQMKQLSEQMTTLLSVVINEIDKNKIQFFCSNPKVLALLSEIGQSPCLKHPEYWAIVVALPQEHLFELNVMPQGEEEQQADCALQIESSIDASACDMPELYN